jgi:crossover junction endodeoxyribonuclease RuvC
MDNNEIILGIDPGTNILGYCVIEYNGRKYNILKIGSINMTKLETHLEKLNYIVDFISNILNEYTPDILAIEEPFYGKNVQSMLKLGRAQGAVMTIAMQHKIKIEEITPRRVKQAITGKGSASKEQVAAMISNITGYDISNLNTDATDAAAIAITHTLQKIKPISKSRSKKNSWKNFINENPDKIYKAK